MNIQSKSAALLALAAVFVAAPAFATPPQQLTIDEIVEATGMEKREVLLMVGPVSNNYLYLTSYHRVSREWTQAVAEAGLLVEVRRDAAGRIVGQVVTRPAVES